MNIVNCPQCSNRESVKRHTIRDFSTSKELFAVVECQKCGLLYTNPRPNIAEIGNYYKSPDYISHTNKRSGLFAMIYQLIRATTIITKESWISRHIRRGLILDYGCGTGEFLNYCQTKGWDARGIEIAEAPRAQAEKNYNLQVLSPEAIDKFNAEEFDVVTMWHVLEHIDDLRESLSKIISKIKSNGLLVVAVPNPDSWDAKHYKEFWAAWDVPIHYYHFKKKNIISLLSSMGMKQVEIKNMPYDAYYISLLSEQYKSGKKNWLKAVFYGTVSNLKSGKNNASSLTYIFKKV